MKGFMKTYIKKGKTLLEPALDRCEGVSKLGKFAGSMCEC